MALPSARARRRIRLVLGCLLLAAGVFGVDRSVRAGSAQRLYHRAKHGLFRDTAREVPPLVDYRAPWDATAEGYAALAAAARTAAARYPANYYFPAFAARAALVRAADAETDEALADAVLEAEYFAREAVSLNPYDAEARAAYADALACTDAEAALSFWRPILDREFWNGANHDEYARLLLLEGSPSNLVLAVREEPLVENPALRRELRTLATSLKQASAATR